tara:strand:+ start:116 stop:877 length:762 start_codon:yes stop_codon:yes gene_type:complete
MEISINEKRINEIISFLNSLNINSERLRKIAKEKSLIDMVIFEEALTHSSANKNINHEKLEFFGDAVLRLSASQFIDKNFQNLSVGKRSELRAHLVSDEWLTKLGKSINLERIINIGPKATGDSFSRDTIIAEITEALIGALYKCFDSFVEINLWLDKYWEEDAKIILNAPYKFNAKSSLQEWCQERGLNLPIYTIKELSTEHGDPKRFLCKLFIKNKLLAISHGKSHKIAEKKAAVIAYEKLYHKQSQTNSS